MTPQISETQSAQAWALARRQHGVIARGQLLDLGFSSEAVKHRVEKGRLHPIVRGVYAVGRPNLTREGRWMAAVLACGPGAVLSHRSAAALWGFGNEHPDPSAPSSTSPPSPDPKRWSGRSTRPTSST